MYLGGSKIPANGTCKDLQPYRVSGLGPLQGSMLVWVVHGPLCEFISRSL